MDKNMEAEDLATQRAAVDQAYWELNETVNQMNEGDVKTNEIYKILKKNDTVYEKAMDRTEVQEAVRDARVISNISDLCLKQTEHMSANVVQFRYSEYAERLVTKMKGVVRENGTVHISQRKLNLLGMEAKQLFFRSPVLVTLNGALGFSQPKPKERKQKVTKLKKTKNADLVSTQVEVLKTAETSVTNTEKMVIFTLQELVNQYRMNSKKPVEYFRFVIDPESFGRSVENIFHVSFLVKEEKAKITVEGSTPYVKPIKPGREARLTSSGEYEKRSQVIMNFTMYDWERIIEAYKLTSAMIRRPAAGTPSKPGGLKRKNSST